MTDKKYLPKIRDYLGHTNKSDGTEKIENPFDRFSNSDDKQRKPRPWKYDEESGLAPTRIKKLNRQTFDGPEFSSPIAYSIIPKSTSIHSQHQGNLSKFENKCTKSVSMQYLQSETAEKIISNTLPGYLICLLNKCGSMTEKSIKFCMTASGDFIKLKKVNGIPYTSDPERAIRGALYSRGLFIKDEQGNWSIIKDRCTQYFDEEVEKIKDMQLRYFQKIVTKNDNKSASFITEDGIPVMPNKAIIPISKRVDHEMFKADPFSHKVLPFQGDVAGIYSMLDNYLRDKDMQRITKDADEIFRPSLMSSLDTCDYLVQRYTEDDAFAGCMLIYSVFREICLNYLEKCPESRIKPLASINENLSNMIVCMKSFQ